MFVYVYDIRDFVDINNIISNSNDALLFLI